MKVKQGWLGVCVLGVLALVACRGGSEPAPTVTPSPDGTAPTVASVTPSATPSAPARPSPTVAAAIGYPKGTRTGEPLVDSVIEQIEQHDWDGLAALVEFTTYPCEAPRPIVPQPLLCRDGMSAGDPMTGFWVSDVEGALWPPERDRIAKAFESTFADAKLDAVYAYSSAEREADAWLPGKLFDVVFVGEAHGMLVYPNLDLSAAGIVHLDGAFASMDYSAWMNRSGPGWLLTRAQ